jgi:hypothetical protein
MKYSRSISFPLATALLIAAACATRERPETDTAVAADAAPAVSTLNLTASDFAFTAPDTVPAGPTRIQMRNSGKEMHHVIVVQLEPGHTLAELKALGPSAGPPAWAHPLGGPIGPMPGGAAATATSLDLAAGTYALICVINSADGVPHMAKGMMRELTVTPATAATAATPLVGDVTITLADYSFTPSTPLTAGKHTIRVVNSGPQPHEVVFVRLQPGKTGAEFAAFAEKPEGAPPGELLGGASFIAGPVENFVELELTPGNYAMMCFVPDAKDGKPHVAHGMIQDFKVQ